MTDTEMLREMINKSSRIIVLSGAGISTESGLPDFRSDDGIFETIKRYGYEPEVLLSRSFFETNPEVFYKYYKETLLAGDPQPNRAHKALYKLEELHKLSAIMTQNIDGLHTVAGNTRVFEMHGSIHRNYCVKCRKSYSLDYVKNFDGVPLCECGGIIKPDVVLYEEPLNKNYLKAAIELAMQADMFIVAGTSLRVYPMAGFPAYYIGDRLVVINKTATMIDGRADLIIRRPLGEVLGEALGV